MRKNINTAIRQLAVLYYIGRRLSIDDEQEFAYAVFRWINSGEGEWITHLPYTQNDSWPDVCRCGTLFSLDGARLRSHCTACKGVRWYPYYGPAPIWISEIAESLAIALLSELPKGDWKWLQEI